MRKGNVDRTTEPASAGGAAVLAAERDAAIDPVSADPGSAEDSREQLHVDLRGIVDILSHHLYSSPKVYLRELLQNATDALEARARLDPGFTGSVRVTSAVGTAPLVVRDDGIGLTGDEMRRLLATIGGSSKRGDFAGARRQFLGQFGIGLLSCFLVGDVVELRSRSARTEDAETIVWLGHADGTFTISVADEPLDSPGTEVRVHPRHGDLTWCNPETTRELAGAFVEHLPVEVVVDGDVVSQRPAPWDLPTEAQIAWCRERFGFDPLGIVPLDSSLCGVRGIGFVLPYTAMPGHRTGDRLYSRGMLVADSDSHLLPGWAFFCRAVIDGGELPVTASREAFQETGSLDIVRERLGHVLLAELIMVQGLQPHVYDEVVELHADGLKALAVSGEDMRDLLRSTMPFRTTQGLRTLDQLTSDGATVPYVADAELYGAMVDLAVRADTLVLDASGPHDVGILTRLDPEGSVFVEFTASDVATVARPEPLEDAASADRLAALAAEVLAADGVEVQVRTFEPETRPALWWPHGSGDADASTRSSLVLNARHPAVERLLGAPERTDLADAVRALHGIGMLLGRSALDPERSQVLAASVGRLIEDWVDCRHG